MLNSIFSLCGFPSDSFLARIPNEKVRLQGVFLFCLFSLSEPPQDAAQHAETP